MAKDYAKRVYTTRRTPKKKRWRIEFVILPVIILMCLAGYGIYSHKAHSNWDAFHWLAKLKVPMTHKSSAQARPANASVQNNQEAEIHFDFYHELPNMQVTIPEHKEEQPSKMVAKIQDPEAPRTDNATRFILQLGEFKGNNEANELRLSLLLSGCEAEVVLMNTTEGKVYRVQRGPFINQAEAKKIQRALQKKGIESILRKA